MAKPPPATIPTTASRPSHSPHSRPSAAPGRLPSRTSTSSRPINPASVTKAERASGTAGTRCVAVTGSSEAASSATRASTTSIALSACHALASSPSAEYQGRNSDTNRAAPERDATTSPARSLRRSIGRGAYSVPPPPAQGRRRERADRDWRGRRGGWPGPNRHLVRCLPAPLRDATPKFAAKHPIANWPVPVGTTALRGYG
jgi:hypothetical protein